MRPGRTVLAASDGRQVSMHRERPAEGAAGTHSTRFSRTFLKNEGMPCRMTGMPSHVL